MRLRLIDRVRRYIRPGPRGTSRGPARSGTSGLGSAPSPSGAGRHRRDLGHRPAGPVDTAPPSSFGKPAADPASTGQAGAARATAGTEPAAASQAQAKWAGAGQARAAIRPSPDQAAAADSGRAQAAGQARTRRPAMPVEGGLAWYEIAHARRAAEGMADCGPLEHVLRREWPASVVPSAPVVRAVNRLAALPRVIKEILAAGLDAIHVGEGGVPELDDMGRLRGIPLPSGRATWDACAGAYGQRKIIVGSRPSSAPDVMCHEVGHALDDIDRVDGRWQSDSPRFRQLYERCHTALVSEFHRQPGDLGRREFFADAFAAIASQQRPALVDMLGGNTRVALDVMLYFNIRYGL